MSTNTLPAQDTPRDVVPLRAVVVRHTPGQPKPYVTGTYIRDHAWSPLLAFFNPLEAVLHAAATNRRTGRWTA